MRFSVIIPLYNKAPYVDKAIRSVLAQTFTDYELIVMDDGSQDDSYSVALKTMEGYGHCRIFRQKNTGVSEARNKGVALSQGEYVCFLDADDWWKPSFLEEMSQLIEDFPEAGIYGTGYTIVNETKHKTRIARIGVEEGFEKGYINYCQVYAKTKCMPLTSISIAILRRVFEEVGGFNRQLKMGEDFDLWIRIAIRNKVAFLNRPLAFYNQDVDVKHRAIGTLPDPKHQFAFCADYLKTDMDRDREVKYIVEYVQIVCLRNYYLSKEYHDRAKKVLDSMDLERHLKESYSKYLRYPIWVMKLYYYLVSLKSKIKYGK